MTVTKSEGTSRASRFPRLTPGRIFFGVSVTGLVVMAFVGGAAWMHFHLPSSDLLGMAFKGGTALSERGAPPVIRGGGVTTEKPGVSRDRPKQTFDGFTLVTTSLNTEAKLVDMGGNTVHTWEVPFSKAMPNPKHVRPLADDQVHLFCCHLYPNGDLLGVYQSGSDTPPGYGLVKLDKDSKVLWRYEASVHHSVDVADDGKIYTLVNQLTVDVPAGMEWISGAFLNEYVVVLSPQGEELAKVSLLEAFRDSPFALTLLMADPTVDPAVPALPAMGPKNFDLPGKKDGPGPRDPRKMRGVPRDAPRTGAAPPAAMGDLLHVNSVRVLPSRLAEKFPMFRPGQALVSMRSISTIAVLDFEKKAVVWSAQGPWKAQHCPEFLDNGRLLIYDNGGSPKGSRVLEFDPATGATPWCYASENATPFFAPFCGMAQRLSNGNTLVVDPVGTRVFEVTMEKSVVWEMGCQHAVDDNARTVQAGNVTSAHRYAPEQIRFLKGDVRARP